MQEDDTEDDRPDVAELLVRLHDAGYRVSKKQCAHALRMAKGDFADAFASVQTNVAHDQVRLLSLACRFTSRSDRDLHHMHPLLALLTSQAIGSRESFPPNVRHLAATLGKSEEVCAEALRLSDHNVSSAVRLLLSPRGAALEQSIETADSRGTRRRARSSRIARMGYDADASAQPEAILNYHELMDENPSYVLADSSAAHAPQRPGRPNGSPHKSKASDASGDSAVSEVAMWSECNSSVDDRVRAMNAHEVEQEEASLSQLLTAVHARRALSHIVRLFAKVCARARAASGVDEFAVVGDHT